MRKATLFKPVEVLTARNTILTGTVAHLRTQVCLLEAERRQLEARIAQLSAHVARNCRIDTGSER